MLVTDFVGYAATIVASTSLVPQLAKVIRTKSANDVSLGMIGMIMTASVLWHIHGWIKHDTPLRISSSITIMVNLCLLFYKMKYSHRVRRTT